VLIGAACPRDDSDERMQEDGCRTRAGQLDHRGLTETGRVDDRAMIVERVSREASAFGINDAPTEG
jgi:hypothetical protein